MMATMSGVYDPNSKIEELDKQIKKIGDRITPALGLFLRPGQSFEREKFEWVNKTLHSFKTTLNVTTLSTTATTVTLSAGTNTGTLALIPGETVLDIADEFMLVNSVITVVTNATAVNVTRAFLSSATASTANAISGAQVIVAGEGRLDGADHSRDDSQFGQRVYNNTMILSRELRLTGTLQAINVAGRENLLNEQAADKLKELMKSLQHNMFHSQRVDGNVSTIRRFGGLRWWANSVGNEESVGAAISFNLIDSTIETMIDRGADPSQICMLVPVRQQRKLNALKPERINGGGQAQSDMTINNFIETYNFGNSATVKVIWCTDLKDDELYFCQEDKITVAPLKGRPFMRKPIAKVGDSDKELLIGEYGLKVENARECLFRKTGLTTTF